MAPSGMPASCSVASNRCRQRKRSSNEFWLAMGGQEREVGERFFSAVTGGTGIEGSETSNINVRECRHPRKASVLIVALLSYRVTEEEDKIGHFSK